MKAFDCTKEQDVEVISDWRQWLKNKGYSFLDSTTVGVFGNDSQVLSFTFEVFRNTTKGKWAVFYPQITEESDVLLFINICNASYATFLLELGVSKTKEALYRTMIETKLNEGLSQ